MNALSYSLLFRKATCSPTWSPQLIFLEPQVCFKQIGLSAWRKQSAYSSYSELGALRCTMAPLRIHHLWYHLGTTLVYHLGSISFTRSMETELEVCVWVFPRIDPSAARTQGQCQEPEERMPQSTMLLSEATRDATRVVCTSDLGYLPTRSGISSIECHRPVVPLLLENFCSLGLF